MGGSVSVETSLAMREELSPRAGGFSQLGICPYRKDSKEYRQILTMFQAGLPECGYCSQ